MHSPRGGGGDKGRTVRATDRSGRYEGGSEGIPRARTRNRRPGGHTGPWTRLRTNVLLPYLHTSPLQPGRDPASQDPLQSRTRSNLGTPTSPSLVTSKVSLVPPNLSSPLVQEVPQHVLPLSSPRPSLHRVPPRNPRRPTDPPEDLDSSLPGHDGRRPDSGPPNLRLRTPPLRPLSASSTEGGSGDQVTHTSDHNPTPCPRVRPVPVASPDTPGSVRSSYDSDPTDSGRHDSRDGLPEWARRTYQVVNTTSLDSGSPTRERTTRDGTTGELAGG